MALALIRRRVTCYLAINEMRLPEGKGSLKICVDMWFMVGDYSKHGHLNKRISINSFDWQSMFTLPKYVLIFGKGVFEHSKLIYFLPYDTSPREGKWKPTSLVFAFLLESISHEKSSAVNWFFFIIIYKLIAQCVVINRLFSSWHWDCNNGYG